jgi:hypothetical protein
MKLLNELLEDLPEELERQVITHASWSERDEPAWRRWIGVLPIEDRPARARHATRGGWARSILPSLPCELVGV